MKISGILPLIVAVLVFAGCAVDPVTLELPVEEPVVAIDPEIIATIEDMGFATDDIYATNDAYIVEGDIIIRKDRLEELKNTPNTRHTYYSGTGHTISEAWLGRNLNSRTGKSTIMIAIEYDSSWAYSGIPGQKLKYDAMKRYYDNISSVISSNFNSIGELGFSFIRNDSYGTVADIYVCYGSSVNMKDSVLLVAEIPLGGYPGSRIYINSKDMTWTDNRVTHLPDSKIRASLTHAIGHCLGFGHTNTNNSGSGSIMGEDSYASEQTLLSGEHDDYSSIMHSSNSYIGTGNNLSGYLTSGDVSAFCTMYPSF